MLSFFMIHNPTIHNPTMYDLRINCVFLCNAMNRLTKRETDCIASKSWNASLDNSNRICLLSLNIKNKIKINILLPTLTLCRHLATTAICYQKYTSIDSLTSFIGLIVILQFKYIQWRAKGYRKGVLSYTILKTKHVQTWQLFLHKVVLPSRHRT